MNDPPAAKVCEACERPPGHCAIDCPLRLLDDLKELGLAIVREPPPPPLAPPLVRIDYDYRADIISIDGVTYACAFFRGLGTWKEGTWLQIVKREDGVLTLYEAAEMPHRAALRRAHELLRKIWKCPECDGDGVIEDPDSAAAEDCECCKPARDLLEVDGKLI
jgi:hypothetical protein